MSINGWIKILSIIFGVDVAKRIDSVAIDYDALNDFLAALTPRKVQVLQLTIDEGMSNKDAAKKLNVTTARVAQIRSQAIYFLKYGGRYSTHVIHRAVSGWWNLTEPIGPTPQVAASRIPDKPQKSSSASCLVITNFNKPVVRVETKETVREVVKVVEKPVTHFREPMWHSVKDLLPHHAGIVVVTDLNLRHDEGNRLMWFAAFNKASREFIFANAVTALTVTHWCELPLLHGPPFQGWDRVYGRYVSLPYPSHQPR